MELIPLIYLKDRKIYSDNEGTTLPLDILNERLEKEREIYIIDENGLEENKPNLCLYPQLAERFSIWVDAGARVVGDIVDEVMAGAAKVTVRKHLWSELNISGIKEITENDIFIALSLDTQDQYYRDLFILQDADGVIIYNNPEGRQTSFNSVSLIKTLSSKYPTYVHDSDPANRLHWQNQGVTGLLIDMTKAQEFSRYEF